MDVTWRKSARSNATGGACVEIARTADGFLTRDSKDPDGPRLRFAADAWRQFVTGLKRDNSGCN